MVVRVVGDGTLTDVPVTPETTSHDVIECCRDPGEESCELVATSPEHGGNVVITYFLCYYVLLTSLIVF